MALDVNAARHQSSSAKEKSEEINNFLKKDMESLIYFAQRGWHGASANLGIANLQKLADEMNEVVAALDSYASAVKAQTEYVLEQERLAEERRLRELARAEERKMRTESKKKGR